MSAGSQSIILGIERISYQDQMIEDEAIICLHHFNCLKHINIIQVVSHQVQDPVTSLVLLVFHLPDAMIHQMPPYLLLEGLGKVFNVLDPSLLEC